MTTSIGTDTTLAEIVTRHPDLARELERRSLDYCCGGQRTLGEACGVVGLDPAATAEELASSARSAPADWAELGPAELVDHLESVHHAYLHDELPRLATLAQKVLGVHGARHPELAVVAQLVDGLREELEPHLAKEERVLFPMIRELAGNAAPPSFHCGSLGNPISVMLAEHDQVGDLLARLRQATDQYAPPPDACASYTALYVGLAELEADTHLHTHKENNLLFPAVLDLEQRR